MLSLHELQREIIRGIDSENNIILNYIQPTEKLSAEQQLEIYRSSVTGILQKALKDIYPVCLKLVGEDFFLAMIDFYIAETKSHAADIGEYGENFPRFIAHFTPANSLPYLSDVARLEWAWHKIFNAADNPVFDFQELAERYRFAADKIILLLPNDCALLSSLYPIDKIFETNQENFFGNTTIVLHENEQYYFIVWRDQLELRVDPLTQQEWQVLSWMHGKLTLGEICHQASNIVELLPTLIQRGWVVGFTYN